MFPFVLPPPTGCSVSPKWDGRNFVLGDQSTPVLEYSENFAGWSDDLTKLHEEAAGRNHPIDIASRNDALAQIRKYMKHPQAVIMEIGCSSGFLIRGLKKVFPEALIIGSDVVKKPLYQLARDFPGIPLIRFDLLQCPLPNQSIDVLVLLNVLEHIENDVEALEKVFNLLKPGGFLIIEVPAGSSLYDAYDAELHHFRRYSLAELEGKLIEAGFIIRRKSHLGFLCFPVFVVMKFLNKLLFPRKNKEIVRVQANSTSHSYLVALAMSIESNYLSHLSLPFGIRVIIVAEKKENHVGKCEDIGNKKCGQTQTSVKKNQTFFEVEYQRYKARVESIDTYAFIPAALNMKLQGIQRLLDIGNGGVFNYNTRLIGEVIGLDLFLDKLVLGDHFPKNVSMVQGNALDIPRTLHSFDGVLMVMLIHHLVGNTVNDCLINIQQLLSEARRVMCPGGRLVIIESCVPYWFFVFEKIVFKPATLVIEKIMKHPSTIQYPIDFLFKMIEKAGFVEVKKEKIPKGKYVLQYGVKVPSWITPVQPILFSAICP